MKCEKPDHELCSVAAISSHMHLRLLQKSDFQQYDTLFYGTSDPTINPAEMWMTALAAARANVAWTFFNYPLGSEWLRQDIEEIFGPHSFPYADTPFAAVYMLGLDSSLVKRFTPMSLDRMILAETKLATMTLEEAVEVIKPVRRRQNFCVLNYFEDTIQKRVFCSKKSNLWYKRYRRQTIGEIVKRGTEKLGGTIIYFLFGWYAAKSGSVILFPHSVQGDVWNAFAAGAKLHGGVARLYPVGGLDVMTSHQWDLVRRDQQWRKAPVDVIRRLSAHPFMHVLEAELLEKKNYCAVSYDTATDTFAFVSDF
ncbi:MAG: hypothetical protein HRF42_05810 [Candidatus Brocadia sp.]